MKQIFNNFIATLRRYKVSSILNILGLGVAFASLYIIATQVCYEFAYNSSIKESERVYNLQFFNILGDGDKATTISSRPLIDLIVSDEPSIESYGSITVDKRYFALPTDGEQELMIECKTINLSESAIEILSPEIIEGSAEKLSTYPEDNLLISKSFATTYSLSVGDNIELVELKKQLKIAAIFSDIAEGNDFSGADIIRDIAQENKNILGNFNYTQFVKFREGVVADEALLRRGMNRINEKYKMSDSDDEELPFRLMPIRDTYFAKDIHAYGMITQGDIDTTITLISIAAVLLIIAIINFLNFFFALIPIRIKAVNTYKIYGATRWGLISTFIIESLGLVMISMGVAAVVVFAIDESSFTELMSAPIAFEDNLPLMFATLGFAVVVAILVTIYPSIYITSFPAAMAIKSGFSASRSGKVLRYTLISVQFVATMILFIYMIFANMQYRYIMGFDMGFNKTDLLTTDIAINIAGDFGLRDNFSDRLKQHSDILDVAYISEEGLISSTRMTWNRAFRDKEIMLPIVVVSPNFLEVMGIDLVEGRSFYQSDEREGSGTFILNEAAANAYEIECGDSIIGTTEPAEIVGICKNITHQHLRYSSSPMAFFTFGKKIWRYPSKAYIRISPTANIKEITEYIRECSDQFSGDYTSALEFEYFDEELGETYAIEHKSTTLITFFAFVSIMISLMGVFGLVLFETQFRQKEIVLRRVHGATVSDILLMLNRKFLIIVAICFVIATPISYSIIDKWLSTFAYQIDLSAWVFIVVLAVVTIVTSLVVTSQSYRAANENPAKLIGKNS